MSNLVLARIFGLGSDMDAFFYATSIPLFIAAILVAFFLYGSVPILSQKINTSRSTSSLFVAACVIASLFFCVSIIIWLEPFYIPNIFYESTGTNAQLVTIAWAVGGVQVIFGAITAIFNSKRYFITPFILQALTPIGAIIGTLLTIPNKNIVFTIIGMLTGLSLATIIGTYILRNCLIWICETSTNDILRILNGNAGSLNTILASCAFTAYATIDAIWAPQFGAGALSTLGYSQRIVIGFGNVVVIGIFMTAGPMFSESLQKYGYGRFLSIVRNFILTVAISAVVLAFVLWINLELLINIIFGKNIQFDQSQSLLSILPLMLLGMVPMLCCTILLRAVLCLKNQNLYIFLFGVGVPVIYIAFCWILSSLGFISIGFAYSISWIFGLGILVLGLILRSPQAI